MATFFDELGRKITQTGQGAVKKTKDMAETAKLNSNISDEQNRLNRALCELGRAYFEDHRTDENPQYANQMALIKQSFDKINEYNNEIQRLKGVRRCSQCGAEISNSATFCTLCGAQLKPIQTNQAPPQPQPFNQAPPQPQPFNQTPPQPQPFNQAPPQPQPFNQAPPQPQAQPAQNVCPNCGKTFPEGTAFCTSCGTALNRQ